MPGIECKMELLGMVADLARIREVHTVSELIMLLMLEDNDLDRIVPQLVNECCISTRH